MHLTDKIKELFRYVKKKIFWFLASAFFNKEMADLALTYHFWLTERTLYIAEQEGIKHFMEHEANTPPKNLWEIFKKYYKEKSKMV